MAPGAMHSHISIELTENGLEESLNTLRATGSVGCWSVAHHSGQNEYTEVGVQLAKDPDVLTRWDLQRLA